MIVLLIGYTLFIRLQWRNQGRVLEGPVCTLAHFLFFLFLLQNNLCESHNTNQKLKKLFKGQKFGFNAIVLKVYKNYSMTNSINNMNLKSKPESKIYSL